MSTAMEFIDANMHGALDDELYFHMHRYVETKEIKHFVVQERDVSYRLYTHYHDYVTVLEDRLRQYGLDALQAADTEYRPGRESLPESVEFTMPAGAAITLPERSGLLLRNPTQARLQDGTQLPLSASMHLTSIATTAATAPQGLHATLVDGMANTPPAGDAVTLDAQQAFLFVDTVVTLTTDTQVILFNGVQATIPAGTEVKLARSTEFAVAADSQATIVKSSPWPVLYANAMDRYDPTALVQRPRPVRDLDFTSSGAYAVYNWELFFHAPLTVAMHLSKNQRFAEAQRWFHYIFDPTDSSDGPTPERFWKVRPFQTTDVKRVEEILVNLATGADPALQADTVNSIDAWQRAPFRPHVIARYRQQAYMYKTVMAYLDNLIAWGDSLFAQDTGEAVDEALMLYVLAATILGPRPQAIPPKGTMKPQTYDNLRKDLAKLGTVLRDVEADAPFDLMPLPAEAGVTSPQVVAARSLGKALYFGVPRNDTLLGYWDTIADRLFKIRNSLNLQGVFRQLALFEPPIDPALLARAAAAGLDVAAIVNGLNQPLPLVRFPVLLQKAVELCQEVKTLGANLLANMEKEDGEALALLRAQHEKVILQLVEHVKYAQLQEAIKAKEGLQQSLQIAEQKYVYYELQLGRTLDQIKASVPALIDLDRASLDQMNLKAAEADVPVRDITVDIATDALALAAGFPNGGKLMSSHEVQESLFLEKAQLNADQASVLNVLSAMVAAAVPQFEIAAEPWGMGGRTGFGGQNIASGISAIANGVRGTADRLNFEAHRAARIDGVVRRERDWAYQSNQAAGEISQIFKQIRAAEIREAIADQELRNHREQMKHAEQIEQFLNEEGADKTGKSTNKAIYTYLKREVKGLYAQCFQMAFDVARKAERVLQHELGDTSLTFLQFGYLAGKEGLLAGERLFLDLKRMELAYLELNRREYELTKHVSLAQVDPKALLQLRATGCCTVELNEDLFNMDGPSHYFRRIKNVALTIPCVTGPYVSVNCTLTLLKSSIRTTATLAAGDHGAPDYNGAPLEDYYGSMQAIVTSNAQNDDGLFETNLRDERYLPFENSGVIGKWKLQLPANPADGDPTQFDYDTISDIVLHIRYTAREGGDALGKPALADLKSKIDQAKASGSTQLFSLRHDFPAAWAAYKAAPKVADNFRPITIKLTPQHYPYWSRTQEGQTCEVTAAVLIARGAGRLQVAKANGSNAETLGTFAGELKKANIDNSPAFTGEWTAALTADGVEDAWLLMSWRKTL